MSTPSVPLARSWSLFESVALPIAAHAWTIGPNLVHRMAPRVAPASQPWSTVLEDERIGPVTLRGRLRVREGGDACVIVVHGLGGSPDSGYCVQAAAAADRAGMSCLRMSLRGADRAGDDFYHGGLAADLEAAAASADLQRFARLYVLGYSLGGHVSLCYALAPADARVRAVAAVCSPLDLGLGQQAIDRTRALIYRHHVLAGLKQIYSAVAAKRSVPTPLPRALAARTLREWDELTVVPRYGFGSVDEYYAQMSVGPRLSELQVPALVVHSTLDPMVPPWTYEPHLTRSLPKLTCHPLASGGHVGFPANVCLGERGPGVLEDQILAWLLDS
jgi:predicted alpha/beta-fold hydrolase